jgi:hypothetical protein
VDNISIILTILGSASLKSFIFLCILVRQLDHNSTPGEPLKSKEKGTARKPSPFGSLPQPTRTPTYRRPWIVVPVPDFRRARFAAISRISRPRLVRFMICCCTMLITLPIDQYSARPEP